MGPVGWGWGLVPRGRGALARPEVRARWRRFRLGWRGGGSRRFRGRRGRWFRWRCTRLLLGLGGLSQFDTPLSEPAPWCRRIDVDNPGPGFLQRDHGRQNRARQEQ